LEEGADRGNGVPTGPAGQWRRFALICRNFGADNQRLCAPRAAEQKDCSRGGIYGFIVWTRAGGEEILLPARTDYGILARVNRLDRKRMQVRYSGQVQGVGFRYTARSVAAGYDVTGFVRNLPDGGVELVAEGSKDELEAFRKAIREAGLGHFIRHEDIAWQEAGNAFRGFEIVR